MTNTFSLRRLSVRYALSLFALPVLLWTDMLATGYHQAHAMTNMTFSVHATNSVPAKSFAVFFTKNDGTDDFVCQQSSPNRWSPRVRLDGDIQRIDRLNLFPDSTNCGPTGHTLYVTNLQISSFTGLDCTFDYRSNQLSGCVNPPITRETFVQA
jgi:hypothetical protein